MTPLSPLDLELLYFLCAAHHHRCRVTRIKGQRQASLKRLRYVGLVSFDGFIPSPSAIADWLERRNETPAGRDSDLPAESPEPEAIAEGGRRCSDAGASPPSDLDGLLSCFSDEFEELILVARRHGVSTSKIVRHARVLLARGLVEQLPPATRGLCCLWRRAQRDTQGASGTARKAPGAAESTAAKRIKDRAPASIPSPEAASPSVDPPAVVPTAGRGAALEDPNEARPRSERSKVDIKVNTGPKPARLTPVKESQDYQRQAQQALRTNRSKAEAFLDSGKTSSDAGSVSLRIEARKVEVRRAEDARLACPIEQAMTKLRRRYTPVYGAEVSGGPAGKFYVGRKLVTKAELLAMAAGVGA